MVPQVTTFARYPNQAIDFEQATRDVRRRWFIAVGALRPKGGQPSDPPGARWLGPEFNRPTLRMDAEGRAAAQRAIAGWRRWS